MKGRPFYTPKSPRSYCLKRPSMLRCNVMSMKKILKTVLIITVIALVLLAMLSFFLPLFIDSDHIRKQVSKQISSRLSEAVKIGQIDFSCFPTPTLQIEHLVISKKKRPFISIKSIVIYPDLFHLLQGHLIVDGMNIKGVTVDSLTFADSFKKESENHSSMVFQIFYPLFSRTNAKKLFPTIFHEQQPEFTIHLADIQTFFFASAGASITISPENKIITGNLEIERLKLNKNEFQALSATTLQSCGTEKISVEFEYTPRDSIRIHGIFSTPFWELNSPTCKRIKTNDVSFSIFQKEQRTQIKILPFTIIPAYATLSGDFIHERNTGNTYLTLKGTDLHMPKTRETALALLKDNKICTEIFHIIREGMVPDVTVSFHGTRLDNLFDEKSMRISGKIQEGNIRIPGTDLVVTNVYGNASVEKGILHTDIFKGALSASILEKGMLTVNLLELGFPFKGLFFLTADLSQLPNALINLLPETRLAREMGLIENIKGRAKGILALEKQEKDIQVTVQAHDINLKGGYQRFPGETVINKGFFSYKKNKAEISEMTGTIGENSVSDLSFNFDFMNDNILEITSGKAQLNAETLFPWLMTFNDFKKVVPPISSLTGNINVDGFNFKGAIHKRDLWKFDIKGKCENLWVFTSPENSETQPRKRFKPNNTGQTPPPSPVLQNQTNAAENFSFQFSHSDVKTELSHINGIYHDTRLLSALSNNKVPENISKPFRLVDATLEGQDATLHFTGKLKFNQQIELIMDLHKNRDNFILNNLNIMENGFSNAKFSYIPQNHPNPFSFTGILRTSTIEKLLNSQKPFSKRLTAITNGKTFTFRSANNSDITISTDTMDLDFILERKHQLEISKAPSLPWSSWFPHTIINFECQTFRHKSMALTPFQAHLAFNGKESTIIIVDRAKFCDINLTGFMSVEKNAVEMSVSVDDKGDEIKKILTCLYPESNLLQGKYSIKTNLFTTGQAVDSAKNHLKNNFKGNLEFHSSAGRIFRLTLLSRILSVINISSLLRGRLPDIDQNGFAFDTIEILADVEKSRINLTHALIKGLDMTLVFRGWIDPLNNQLNLTCLVAPFKTADIIIEKIPLLGTMLNNQLISIPVQISGSMENPDVTPLPPTAVGKGLINTMQNILTAPFKLIEKIP